MLRTFVLIVVLSVLSQGTALAGFGGEEETLAPVGSPGGEWGGMETVELTLGPGAEPLADVEPMVGPMVEPMMDAATETLSVPGEIPGTTEAYAGAATTTRAYSLTTWKPSQEPVGAYPMQAMVTPIGGIDVAYDTSVGAYYMSVAPPAAQQAALMAYDIQRTPPVAVYYNNQLMAWSSFIGLFPSNAPTYWVSTSTGWQWYTVCPDGAWVPEMMFVPWSGYLKVYEIYQSGVVKAYSYGWTYPGYKYIWFFADAPGRHITFFTIGGKTSNAVTIDVVV